MKVLWVPIFSMRSYVDGKYAILKDGNFQLTMARIFACNFGPVTIAVPSESSDFDEVVERFKHVRDITFLKVRYGTNAVDTRETFWEMNYPWVRARYELDGAWDLLITDITGYPGKFPVIYNFNITKLPELDRPYIDKFFEQDLKSIEQSLFTTVLNPRQREYILEVRPDLMNKVIVHTKCVHQDLIPRSDVPIWPFSDKVIFWPFRISDAAYKWEEFVETFIQYGLDDSYQIIVTDPNDTLKNEPWFVTKIKPTKEEYYRLLDSRPTVVMLDDIDTVLHPGTVEFFAYNCPVITFKSKLIDNPNSISNLSELEDKLNNLVYNSREQADWLVHPFFYERYEIDELYNECNPLIYEHKK